MFKKFVIAIMVILLPSAAWASDTYSGHIIILQTVDTGSMQFRVSLDTAMTNCTYNFAFVEPSSTVFSAYVSGMTTAYSLGKTVSLQVNRETSGYCRIFFLSY
jgi:hypothetical protein